MSFLTYMTLAEWQEDKCTPSDWENTLAPLQLCVCVCVQMGIALKQIQKGTHNSVPYRRGEKCLLIVNEVEFLLFLAKWSCKVIWFWVHHNLR